MGQLDVEVVELVVFAAVVFAAVFFAGAGAFSQPWDSYSGTWSVPTSIARLLSGCFILGMTSSGFGADKSRGRTLGRMRRSATDAALEGHNDPALVELREQARNATTARRLTFAARLPLPAGAGTGDVPFWSAAIEQIERNQWKLTGWSVCPEAEGPVAYAVFSKA